MKKVMIWFLLSCKRYVRKPSFLVILLLLPLGILAADKSQGHKDPEIKIAVSVQGGDDWAPGWRKALWSAGWARMRVCSASMNAGTRNR